MLFIEAICNNIQDYYIGMKEIEGKSIFEKYFEKINEIYELSNTFINK